ncbi:transglycosylase family protein [Pseudonocardia thermophila]|uniref:LysM peptidoglycan-binding domain-containing protein n=1 Tax=Pseudonocardia thermophila TaxID=1848 RepID=UPI00248ECA7A|nr:transglycosylase family protein [Pseudonocardia thermophila]
MARYRGRHRAPSTTGRTIARTALAGAVAGAPFIGMSTPAFAAPDSVWDRLAQCESGGRWNINTGNGYYGGLQFSLSTWRAFGGTGMPHQASREQQIAVAERVLAVQGWKAWPSCSKKIGASGVAEPNKRVVAKNVSAAPAAPTSGNYVVQPGDTLAKIAAAKGIKGGWKAIVAKNPALAGAPDRIFPGMRITL